MTFINYTLVSIPWLSWIGVEEPGRFWYQEAKFLVQNILKDAKLFRKDIHISHTNILFSLGLKITVLWSPYTCR
jgi:hypothetical protein